MTTVKNIKNETRYFQPALIEPIPAIVEVNLVAPDSPRFAYYRLAIHRLSAGYIIEKASGGQGAKPQNETWWRPTLALALAKMDRLKASKMNSKRKGRVYIDPGEEINNCIN